MITYFIDLFHHNKIVKILGAVLRDNIMKHQRQTERMMDGHNDRDPHRWVKLMNRQSPLLSRSTFTIFSIQLNFKFNLSTY